MAIPGTLTPLEYLTGTGDTKSCRHRTLPVPLTNGIQSREDLTRYNILPAPLQRQDPPPTFENRIPRTQITHPTNINKCTKPIKKTIGFFKTTKNTRYIERLKISRASDKHNKARSTRHDE